MFKHPSTWLQNSSVQSGKQLPPHLSPNLPIGQGILQFGPKYPGSHSAEYNNYSKYSLKRKEAYKCYVVYFYNF